MKKPLIVILSSLVMACTTYATPKQWTKPGATSDQFSRDSLTCRQAAMQEAALNGLSGNMFVEVQVTRLTKECLHSLGYTATY